MSTWREFLWLGPARFVARRLPPTALMVQCAALARRLVPCAAVFLAALFFATPALAQTEPEGRQIPQLHPPAPVTRAPTTLEDVWIVPDVGQPVKVKLQSVTPGEGVSAAEVRRAMRELLETGRYASVRAELQPQASGRMRLSLFVAERRVVSRIDVHGGELDEMQVRDALGLRLNQELTREGLEAAAARVRLLYVERGFPLCTVSGAFDDAGADEQHTRARGVAPPSVTAFSASAGFSTTALRAIVTVTVAPGPAALVRSVRVTLPEQALPQARTLARGFGVSAGERIDHVELDGKKQDLLRRLKRAGFVRARVEYRIEANGDVLVEVLPGEQVSLRYEGLRVFDEPTLRAAIEGDADQELALETVRSRVLTFYEQRGYFDTRVRHSVVRSADGLREQWVFSVQEGPALRIGARYFPCLSGPLSTSDVNDEIDGVLGEQLPGGDTVLVPADPGVIDQALEGATNPNRVTVLRSEPWTVYSPGEYERAVNHLSDLYRAEGYLSATVGPATLLRRRCAPGTRGAECVPVGARFVPEATCPTVDSPLPVEGEPSPAATCAPNPEKGVFCESAAAISIPIKLGPRTVLWDVEFQGNRLLVDTELFEAAELPLGQPLSQIELQRARRRVGEYYGDRGFAFAEVNVELDLSPDRTRGKARFVISEREPVTIRGFVIRGAERTLESVVLGRLALRKGQLYRRDLARTSEEQLGTLGVFSSVSVELEDPDVPAREKVVVVSVEERPSQYIDIKPGFSSGEGARLALEYGHRNLFGRALQLRLRLQLGYLANDLIFDAEVRRKFERLTFAKRLERRNSATIEVPFAQRFRFAVEGVDVRDNARDFGLTKRAAIVSMSHRPSRSVSWVTGTSFEDNEVEMFTDRGELSEYLMANPQYVRLLNVPEGGSYAIAFRLGGVWDRTDNPFGATRGTFVSLDSEPVIAFLDSGSTVAGQVECQTGGGNCEYVSRFVRLTSRLAGYIPFNDKGLSLALSLRVGANVQVVEQSITYTDRLFFLGGSDSLRGHLQDSVFPEDFASELSAGTSLTKERLPIRGGDVVINPRAELRIPLTGVFQTALFLDTGNVWRDIHNVQPWVLRYTAGTGLRVSTPVGPLAFDYGLRLDRRSYESDIGAFHFSVGLF